MKLKTQNGKLRRVIIAALAVCFAVAFALAMSLFGNTAYAAGGRYNTSVTMHNISAGVRETKYYTNVETTNDDQVVAYAIEIDLKQNTLIAGYKDYDTSGKWGMDTVRNHVAAAETARPVKVVAAVNGDFFNMATGEPTGALVMNGKTVHKSNGRIYFAILKNGDAVIRTGEITDDVQEAIGAASMLIQGGAVVPSPSDTTKQPRTAVGIKADGTVVLMVADGRQAPYSSGYSLYDLACKMQEQGCVVAANLDGGGSTTYLAKYAGTDDLTLANSPSDGQERSVSSSLLVVSNAEPTGIFASAEITPNNEVYTPGSSVTFTALGVDTAGFSAEIPEEAYWRVSQEDAAYGEITELEDGSGEFISKAEAIPSAGTDVTVELVYQDKVVGSSTIELRNPDSLSFSSSAVTLAFGERTDLGLTALWQQREVHLRDSGDLEWTISAGRKSDGSPSLDEEGNPLYAGAMDGNIFVADEEATDTTSTVTVKSAANPSLTASVEVSVGQMPTVVWDFEDVYDEETGTTIPAEEYYDTENGNSAFSASNAGAGAITSSCVVSSEDGYPVRMGSHSLRVDYDFTNVSKTDGAYFGPTYEMIIPGKPTAIGVWMYTPANTRNLWLRGYLYGYNYNEDGEVAYVQNEDGSYSLDNTYRQQSDQPAVVNFTAQSQVEADALGIPYYSDYYPEGWHYYEAPIATYSTANGVTTLTPIAGDFYVLYLGQALRLMVVPGINMGVNENGKGDKSYVYFDDFQFVYGSQTNDVNAPEITYAYIANPQGDIENTTLEDGVTINSSMFQVHAQYVDYTDRFDTGVIPENVHIYIDGNQLEYGSRTGTQDAEGNATQSEGNVQSVDYYVPNGSHVVTIEVGDYAGNYTTQSYTVNVQGASEFETVSLVPAEGAVPLLNSDYGLELYASDMSKVESVVFELTLRSEFMLDAEPAEGFNVVCNLTNAVTNTYTIEVTRKEGTEAAEGAGAIASVNISIPKSLAAGIPLVYSVDTSKVTYIDGFQEYVYNDGSDVGTPVMNSFCLDLSVSVEAYYEISTDVLVVGNNNKYSAYIYVTHAGEPASGVTITVDGTLLEGVTDEKGRIALPESFLDDAAIMQVVAEDENGNVSFATTAFSRVPAGEGNGPLFVSAKANENSQTEQSISWLANPLNTVQKALIKYMTVAEYEANGNSFDGVEAVEGTSQLLDIGESNNAADNSAVLVNSIELGGLKRNTEYVYIVGDGTVWSEVHYFSTTIKGGNTDFFVLGDTQAENAGNVEAIAQAIGSSGKDYSFGIQTGDFIDSASSYAQWAEILNVFSSNFSNVDMVQVLGNHEYAGDLDGNIAATINMLPGTGYYSVTYGNVYVAVISYTYTSSLENLQEALAWLVEDAKSSDAIWKVLTLHQPAYYTNPTGGSDYVHQYLPIAVDEAGIDVVFSGHDHAYARTLPMTGGKVDEENGAVYYIAGSTGEKSYDVVWNDAFNFAVATNDYTAIYISVEATDETMTITTYNLGGTGVEIFDTYTIRKNNACTQNGHSYVYDGEYILCTECGYCMTDISSFSGLITDTEGRLMYFVNGEMHTGWMTIGEDTYYFGEDGLGVNGTVTFQESHCYDNYASGDIDYYFENGLMVGGYTGKYGVRYFVNGVMYEGWIELEDGYYYFTTTNDFGLNGVRRGDRATGIATVYTNTQPYNTLYKVTLDETGKFIGGYFHYRDYNGLTSFTDVRNPHSEDGIWIVYRTNEWVDYNGNLYYANGSGNLVKGLYAVDGVMYEFDDSEGSPAETNSCKLIGKYTGWNGEKYYVEGIEQSGWTIIDGDYYYFATAEEVDFAPDAGFEVGDRLTGNAAVYSPTQPYGTFYYINFAEDGKYISGDWHKRSNGGYARTQVAPPTDDSNIWISYINGAFEVDGKEYYAVNGIIVTGDYVIDGVKFKFSTEGTSPEEGLGAKLGRYYTITFICDEEVSEIFELYQQSLIVPPEYVKPVDSTMVAAYDFLGWYNGEEMFEDGMVASANVTYTAKYQKVHAALYYDIAEVLAALEETAESGTPADRHDAVDDVTELYETLTAENIADAEDEGLSFELYEQMLGKLYEVSFISNGITITSKTLYEGEAVNAPMFDPIKASSSSMVASYAFKGWYNGEVQWTAGVTATADATYTAAFSKVYSTTYNTLKTLTDALAAAQTPAEKHIAVSNLRTVYATLTEKDKTDAEAEGLSFAQYEEMLGKLYEVTFVAEGKTVSVTEYYEGEAIAAPAAPEKSGNRVKSYEFDGWYNGEDVLAEGATATSDALYEAKYILVYTEKFTALKEALEALAEVGADGSLEAQYEALSAVYVLYEEFGSAELRDAVAEGLSFAQYEEMLEAYNGAAQGAEEDLAAARILANRFADAAAAVIALASAAYVTLGRRW